MRRWPCCQSVSKISSVTSVYCESSMSTRTKNPAGSARSRIRRRLSTAVALSTSSPSGVGFVQVRDALAQEIERLLQAARFDRASGVDRLAHLLAGDEPAGEAARPA